MEINEEQLEQLALTWFQDSGWEYRQGPDIAPDGDPTEREDYRHARLGFLSVLAPPMSLRGHFGDRVVCLRQDAANNERQNKTLGHVRDALHLKLLSGRLPIANAVKLLENTA